MSGDKSAILVLGAASDIGREIIRSLDDGSSLIFAHYHTGLDKITALQAEIRSTIVPIRADLGSESDVAALVAEVKNHCTCPDKIVHLPAPKFAYVRFRELPWETFQHQLDVELKSIVLILREFLPLMASRRAGRIVLMLSSCCFGTPPKNLAHYTTTKYALLGLMKSVAVEYADKHITCNALSPSMVETKFLSEVPEKVVELAAAGHPLKRNGLPRDIAPLVKFLLSEESSFINGANIPVTGGSVF